MSCSAGGRQRLADRMCARFDPRPNALRVTGHFTIGLAIAIGPALDERV